MKRFSAIWLFSGTYSDQTTALGEGIVSVDLTAGQTMYFGADDWFAGIMTFLSALPTPSPSYALEYFNGDEWAFIPLEEILVNQQIGTQIQRGSLYWGSANLAWASLAFDDLNPETAIPIDSTPRFWVRLRVLSGVITIDRVLPQMFNTYVTVNELGGYIGYTFDDINVPTRADVRKMIRANEDWLDQYTRRSSRPRIAYAETYDFNPYGFRLRRYPPWFIVDLGMWNGSSFESMVEGRGKDFFLDQNSGMLRFMLPSFRLRYYSFLLSRYLRQPNSIQVTYAYGEDFDVSRYAADVKSIILMKTGADLIAQNDWTGIFRTGTDNMTKEQKMGYWNETAMTKADELRMPIIA